MVTYYQSKKNKVTACFGVVCKHVLTHSGAAAEAVRLRRLKRLGLAVPTVLCVLGKSIYMRRIRGETVTDALERLEGYAPPIQGQGTALESGAVSAALPTALAQALCTWLVQYYHAVDWEQTGEILDDVNCRNFMITKGNHIYGLDFEADAFGTREENIGQLLAFLQSYHPADTHCKRELCTWITHNLCTQLGLAAPALENARKGALQQLALRRAKKRQEGTA